MSRSPVRSFLAVAVVSLAAFTAFGAAGCGDTVHNNEGACVAQSSIDPASGCDGTKSSYYTCPGAAKPALDGGACTFSKVNGGFCCPLPTAVGNGTQTGQIIDLLAKTPVVGATIDFGNGLTTTTDAKGNYSLQIVQNKPFNMTVTAPNYTQLTEQEWFLTGDYNNSTTSLVSAAINTAVSSGLPSYDATKVALGLGVYPEGACKDNGGSVITIDPPTAGKLVYFSPTGTPNTTATSVQSGALNPSALLYNIDPAAPLPKISATPPAGCTVAPYPFALGTVTYTGNFKLLPSGVNGQGFFRVFIQ